MNTLTLVLTTALVTASAPAWSQVGGLSKSDPGMHRPLDPGMSDNPKSSKVKPPKRSGMVVVPPKTDSDAIETPPKDIDPGIKAAPDPGDNDRPDKKQKQAK